ncbi:MAG TPA: hypothetical protein VGM56_29605 [Byssovorax sp.]
MSPALLVPIIALLSVFGMPVAIVYVLKYFRLKEQELRLEEAIARGEQTKLLEARVAKLESTLGALDRDVRRALAAGDPPAQALPAHETSRTGS